MAISIVGNKTIFLYQEIKTTVLRQDPELRFWTLQQNFITLKNY